MKKISLIKSKRHVIYAKKSFVSIKMMKIIKTEKRLKITAIKDKFRGAAQSKCTLNYKIPKDIPIINHNASYDTHFIISQLAEEFQGELNCIGDNMEKYVTFSVPIKKERDDGKTTTRKLRFINSFRSMSTSLPELVDNMTGILNSIECKSCIEKIKVNSAC